MSDPYAVLGLPLDSDDEAIRRRYLELVKQFPPEHHAARFAAIREAYEQLRDVDARLHKRLFEVDAHEQIEALVEEVVCRSPRRRPTLKELVAAAQELSNRS